MEITQSISGKISEDYWVSKLMDAEFTSFHRGGERSMDEKHLMSCFSIEHKLLDKINTISKQSATAKFVLHLSILTFLVRKYSTNTVVLIATPDVQSTELDREQRLLFFNIDSSRCDNFKDMLSEATAEFNRVVSHRNYQYESFLERFGARSSEGHQKLYNVGLSYEGLNTSTDLSNEFAILFSIEPCDNSEQLVIHYKPGYFTERMILQLGKHYIHAMERVLEGPSEKIELLDILDKEDLNKLLIDFNNGQQEIQNLNTIHDLFLKQVDKDPKAIALVCDDKEYSYQTVNQKSNQLANFICENYSIRAGDRIGIMVTSSERMIIGMLAILKSGAAYVPIDPRYPVENNNFIFQDADLKAILIDQEQMFMLNEFHGQVFVLDLQLDLLDSSSTEPLAKVSYEDLAYVIYTSGSTGKPKGVSIKHRNITNTLLWRVNYYDLNKSHANLQIPSFAFDSSVEDIFCTLISGGKLVIPTEEHRNNIASLSRLIREKEVKHLLIVPSLYRLYLDQMSEVLGELDFIVVAGEAVPRSLVSDHYTALPFVKLYNEYGPTEASVCSTACLLSADKEISIGSPISNMCAYVLDDVLRPVAIGVTGELCLSGRGIGPGYIGLDSLTDQKFIRNPFLETDGYDRLYKTGDLAYWQHDGSLRFVGRVDNQVKIRGNRVELEQVESVLSDHSDIRSVTVTTIEQENGLSLAAYFVSSTPELSGEDLRAHLMSRLPYFMIPSHFIRLDLLPLKVNGKVDKTRLPLPTIQETQQYIAPRDEFEKKLVEIWTEVLGIEKIGVADNFFAVGGDSIKGIRIINKIQDWLGEVVHLASFFEAPTIETFSQHLQAYKTKTNGKIDKEKIAQFRNIIQKSALPSEGAKENKQTVFLLCPPRSGSTLMRVILAGHPSLFVPPELEILEFNDLEERNNAFTGKFSFYQEGLVRAVMQLKNFSVDEAKVLLQQFELQKISIKELYQNLLKWAEERGQLLVDKTAYYALDINILKKAECYFENAKYIHLIRNPYPVIYSYERQKADQLFRYQTGFPARELAELIWLISQENILSFLSGVPVDRKLNIYFEDLVADPHTATKRICEFLSVPYYPELIDVYDSNPERMVDGVYKDSRMIGDNRFFSHNTINKEVATEWLKNSGAHVICDETMTVAKQLGYFQEEEKVETGIEALPVEGYYDVSFAQGRLWVLQQFKEVGAAYTICTVVEFCGELDEKLFNKAAHAVIQRHEVLRTTFFQDGDSLKQIVHDKNDINFELLSFDFSKNDSPDDDFEIINRQFANWVFDLINGPLVKAALCKMEDSRYRFIYALHHIVADGWSLTVLFRELSMLYNSYKRDQTASLNDIRIHYKDFAFWQNRRLSGDNLNILESYWRQQFSGEIPVINFPLYGARPVVKTYHGSVQSIQLEKILCQKMREFSKQKNSSMFITLLAVVKTLLYKFVSQEDIVVGTPIIGRDQAELENQIGFYQNMIPLRTRFSRNESFISFFEKVRKTTIDGYQHKEFPFDRLVEILNLSRDTARSPLFDVMITIRDLETGRSGQFEMDGIAIKNVHRESKISKYDLTFYFDEGHDTMNLSVEYNTDIFSYDQICCILRSFNTLGANIMGSPDKNLSDFAWTHSDDVALMTSFGKGPNFHVPDSSIHELFVRQTLLTPQKIAVRDEVSNWTYEELNKQSDQVCSFLIHACDVKAGQPVILLINRSVAMVSAIMGVLKAGACYVPVEPSSPIERIKFIATDCGSKIALTSDEFSGIELTQDIVVYAESQWNRNSSGLSSDTILTNHPSTPAYIMYTSGSTGKPKGVMVEHQQVVNFFASMANEPGIVSTDKLLAVTSFAFDISLLELIWPLCYGAQVYIWNSIGKTKELTELIRYEEITILQATPSLWEALLKDGWQGNRSLRALCGGEQMSSDLAARLLPQVASLWNMYGPTETTIWATITKIAESKSTPPIGKPIANVCAFVLDNDNQLVPPNVPGTLYLGGACVSRGYVNRPELNREHFVTTPFSFGTFFATGDKVYFSSNGQLNFLGRKDNQIKIRGHRVELGEIENVLLSHTDIDQGIVKMFDNLGDKILVAYFVSQQPIGLEDIRKHVMTTLPSYMVPSIFCQIEKIPLTPNGKLDRNALRLPDVESHTTSSTENSEYERKLSSVWSEVLHLENIGINENFFQLGGHSLKGIQVLSRVRDRFNVSLELRDIFEFQTISALAERILNKDILEAQTPIPKAAPVKHYPLSFSQERIWILEQFGGADSVYNMPGAFEIHGNFNEDCFKRAMSQVLHRFEVLQTTIEVIDSKPQQKILDDLTVDHILTHVELLSDDYPALMLEKFVSSYLKKPFAFDGKSPLLRCRLIKRSNNEYIFVFVMHHIISDAWSIELFMQSLLKFYLQEDASSISVLPPLPIQFKDFAVWERELMLSSDMRVHRQYWLNKFKDGIPVMDVVSHRARPTFKTYHGNIYPIKFGKSNSDFLKSLVVTKNKSLFVTLTTMVGAFLYRFTGQRTIVMGTPVTTREIHTSLENQIGMFLNLVPLIIPVNENENFMSLLDKTNDIILEAFQHKGYPFDKLVGELALERDTSRSPLFDVLITIQNRAEDALASPSGLTVKVLSASTETSKYDLSFFFSEDREGNIGLHLEYNTDLFSEDRIRNMMLSFENMLSSLNGNAASSIASLPILTREELKLLSDFNNTERPYNKNVTISRLFENQVTATPDDIALVCGKKRITYRELNIQANKLAYGLLTQYGVIQGSKIGFMMRRTEEIVITMLAILKAGCAYVPIDNQYPASRVKYLIQDSDCKIVLTDAATNFPVMDLSDVSIDVVCIDKIHRQQNGINNISMEISAACTAYIIYTSGSSGDPKGVEISHQNASNFLTWAHDFFSLHVLKGVLATSSVCFDLSVFEIFVPITCGGKVVLMSDLFELAGSPLREEVTLINTVPSLMDTYLADNTIPTSVEIVNLAGERLTRALVNKIYACSYIKDVYNLYGPSEATTYATCTRVGNGSADSVTIGRPISNTKIYILGNGLMQMPMDVPGELCIGGDLVAKGYLKKDALTRKRFIFHNGERLYLTGDIAYVNDKGDLFYIGRYDNQVKINGHRIELGEIEAKLMASNLVRQAVVIAEERKNGNSQLVAYIIPKNTEMRNESIQSYLHDKLPQYMVPEIWISLEELPLTHNGKIDRKALQGLQQMSLLDSYVPATDELDLKLVGIWQDLMGIDQIGIYDNFFELGGNSLLAIRIVTAIKRILDVQLSIKSLFLYKNIKTMADAIRLMENKNISSESELMGYSVIPDHALHFKLLDGAKYYPVTPLQFYWLDEKIDADYKMLDRTHGSMHLQYDIMGVIDLDAFKMAIHSVVLRHESLRSTFHFIEGEYYVKVNSSSNFWSLEFEDMRNIDDVTQTERFIDYDGHKFHLAQGPLLCFRLIRTDIEKYILSIKAHHVIVDTWSKEIFFRDFFIFYTAFVNSRQPQLPTLNWHLKEYFSFTNHFIKKNYDDHKKHWDALCQNLPPELIIPGAKKTWTKFEDRVLRSLEFEVSNESVKRLIAVAKDFSISLFEVLQAGFIAFMQYKTGQNDIVFGTDIFGRDGGMEDQIGCYASTVLIRTILDTNDSFFDIVEKIKRSNDEMRTYRAYTMIDALKNRLGDPHINGTFWKINLQYTELYMGYLNAMNVEPIEKLPLRVTPHKKVVNSHTTIDMHLRFTFGKQNLHLNVQYDSSTYEDDSIKKLVSEYLLYMENATFTVNSTKHNELLVKQINYSL
jgi:amino acid adenylation domain-containing protein